MSTIEKIVRECLCKALNRPLEQSGELNMNENLAYQYGIGSLELIMLMTGVCAETDVPLTELTEDDIGRLRTPADIVALLTSKKAA